MNKWREVRINEIGKIVAGGTPSTKINEYWNGEIGWITPKDLSNYNSKYILNGERNITKEGLKRSSAKLMPKGSILMTSRAPIGYLAIANNDISTNQGFKNIICDEELVNNEFLYYYLKANIEYVKLFSSGATFPEISGSKFKNIKIQIPDLETQEKIADILSTYDELIENNNRRIEILEKAAEEIYKEWFVRMRFPGYENTKFIKGIPEGWEVKKLKNFSKLVHGYTESANEIEIGPKYLRGTDINKNSYINWEEVPYCEIDKNKVNKYKLYKNDIVIIRMADPGKVAIVEKDTEAVFASYLIKIDYDENKIRPYYMFYTLYSAGYQDHIKSFSNGTTRSSINSKMILNSKIIVPSIQIQEKFNEIMKNHRIMMNKLLDENQNLIKQRDLLLARLMNGTIEVK